MKVGVPKEIRHHEYRVGLTPSSVRELVAHGHEVIVQSTAGAGIGAGDEAYRTAGAQIAADAAAVFARAELLVKVQEPQAAERALLRPQHVLFTWRLTRCSAPTWWPAAPASAPCSPTATTSSARSSAPTC